MSWHSTWSENQRTKLNGFVRRPIINYGHLDKMVREGLLTKKEKKEHIKRIKGL